jgi:hypothetical protein
MVTGGRIDETRMPITFLRAEAMDPLLSVQDQQNPHFLAEVDTLNEASGDGDTI